MKLVKRGITRKRESAAHAEQKDRATTAKKEVCPNQSTRSRKPENEVSSSTMRASRRKRPRLPPRRKPPHSAPTASSSPPLHHGNENKRVRVYKRVSFYRSPAPSLCIPEHHTLTRVMAESQSPVTNVQVRRQGPRTRMSFQAEETSVQEDTLYAEQKERATRAKKDVHPNQSTRSRKSKNEHSASSASSSPPPSLLAEETSVQEDTLYAEQKERATRAKKEVHPNQSTRSRKSKNEHSASSASSSPPPPHLHSASSASSSPPPLHLVSSSTMRASRRKRPRLPPRRKPPHSAPTASSSPPLHHGNENKRVRVYKRVSFYRSPAPSLCIPEHHTLTGVMAESQGPVTNAQVRREGPRTRMSFQAEETSVQEDTLYAEQKERATRAKKEVHPNQSTRSRKAKNEGNKKKKRRIFSISTTSSSPAPSTCIPQAEEPFVQEDAQAYAVQKRRATRSRPPEYEHTAPTASLSPPPSPPHHHTAPTASLSPPPSPPHHVSSSTMRASRRKRRRLPTRCKPPHRPLTRALTKVQPPVTRTQARQVRRDPDAISDIP